MDDMSALTHQLEHLFLKKVIAGLRDESLTIPQAKADANAFLAIEPFTSAEETYIKVMDFVKANSRFIELKEYMNAYQKEKNDRAKIAVMREHMKQNNLDAAIAVAKG